MADRLKTFQEVLAAAVADMVEFGFDSQERVDRWMRELKLAAERSLISPQSLEQQLRDGLATVYRRMVDQGGYVRYNPGVERFTLDKVKPMLRAELDRRIAASANLIKLNRQESIDKTLRRFQGWSTSIPPGGVSAESKTEVKSNVRRALAQLPHAERFVIIDQSHKLIASINEIVATDGGAIAAFWISNYMQPNYAYRPDHKERDYRQNSGEPYLIRDSWAHREGLVKKGKLGYTDEVDGPSVAPFCRCYYRFAHNLRDLPAEMLTAKGKAMLGNVQAQENVRSARTARADSAEVSREIPKIPVPCDRDHDIATLFAVSPEGGRLYVDRTIPRQVIIKGFTVDPAELGWAAEHARWKLAMGLTAVFMDRFLRRPDEDEQAEIDRRAGIAGAEAAQEAAKRIGLDWDGWQEWANGERSRLERRVIRRPIPASLSAA